MNLKGLIVFSSSGLQPYFAVPYKLPPSTNVNVYAHICIYCCLVSSYKLLCLDTFLAGSLGAQLLECEGRLSCHLKIIPCQKIGLRFDKPMLDGVDFGGLCDNGHGFFCNANELCLDTSGVEDLDKLLINTMFETVFEVSRDSPFILFMKDAEKCMAGNSVICYIQD